MALQAAPGTLPLLKCEIKRKIRVVAEEEQRKPFTEQSNQMARRFLKVLVQIQKKPFFRN